MSETDVMRKQHRTLTDVEQANCDSIKIMGATLYDFYNVLGQSREISIAKTKLEESVMWAIKHVTK